MIKNPIIKYFLIFWLITLFAVIGLGTFYLVRGVDREDVWNGLWDEEIVVSPWMQPDDGSFERDATCRKIGVIDSNDVSECYADDKAYVMIAYPDNNWRFDVGQANIISTDNKFIYVWKRDSDKFWVVTVYDRIGTVQKTLPKILIPNEGNPSGQTLADGTFVVVNEKVCRETGCECCTPAEGKQFEAQMCSGIPAVIAFDANTGKEIWLNDTPLLADLADVLDVGVDDSDKGKVVKFYNNIEFGNLKFGTTSALVSLGFNLQTGELQSRNIVYEGVFPDGVALSIIENADYNATVELVYGGEFGIPVKVDKNWLEYTVIDGLNAIPALDDNAVVISSPARLTAIDFKEKKVIWTKEMNYFGDLPASGVNDDDIGLYIRDKDAMNSETCATVELEPGCSAPEKKAELAKTVDACLEELKESKEQITAIDLRTGKTLWTYESNMNVLSVSASSSSRLNVVFNPCVENETGDQVVCTYTEPFEMDFKTGKLIK